MNLNNSNAWELINENFQRPWNQSSIINLRNEDCTLKVSWKSDR